MHQLNVVPVDFLFLIFLIDFLLYSRTGKEEVQSNHISGRHVVTVSKPHLVVVRVEGPDPILRSTRQLANSQIPLFEIFAFLFALLDFNVEVTVRSELQPHIIDRVKND